MSDEGERLVRALMDATIRDDEEGARAALRD
jgi:hypothetical protein